MILSFPHKKINTFTYCMFQAYNCNLDDKYNIIMFAKIKLTEKTNLLQPKSMHKAGLHTCLSCFHKFSFVKRSCSNRLTLLCQILNPKITNSFS